MASLRDFWTAPFLHVPPHTVMGTMLGPQLQGRLWDGLGWREGWDLASTTHRKVNSAIPPTHRTFRWVHQRWFPFSLSPNASFFSQEMIFRECCARTRFVAVVGASGPSQNWQRCLRRSSAADE